MFNSMLKTLYFYLKKSKSEKEWIYVYIWLVHFAVQQETNKILWSNYSLIKIN